MYHYVRTINILSQMMCQIKEHLLIKNVQHEFKKNNLYLSEIAHFRSNVFKLNFRYKYIDYIENGIFISQ